MNVELTDIQAEYVLLAFYLGRQKLLNCIALTRIIGDLAKVLSDTHGFPKKKFIKVVPTCCLCKEKEFIFKDLWKRYHRLRHDIHPVTNPATDQAWREIQKLWIDVEKRNNNGKINIVESFQKACQSLLIKHKVFLDFKTKYDDRINLANWVNLISFVKAKLDQCFTYLFNNYTNRSDGAVEDITLSSPMTANRLSSISKPKIVPLESQKGYNPTNDEMYKGLEMIYLNLTCGEDFAKPLLSLIQSCRTEGLQIYLVEDPKKMLAKFMMCVSCLCWSGKNEGDSVLEVLFGFYLNLGTRSFSSNSSKKQETVNKNSKTPVVEDLMKKPSHFEDTKQAPQPRRRKKRKKQFNDDEDSEAWSESIDDNLLISSKPTRKSRRMQKKLNKNDNNDYIFYSSDDSLVVEETINNHNAQKVGAGTNQSHSMKTKTQNYLDKIKLENPDEEQKILTCRSIPQTCDSIKIVSITGNCDKVKTLRNKNTDSVMANCGQNEILAKKAKSVVETLHSDNVTVPSKILQESVQCSSAANDSSLNQTVFLKPISLDSSEAELLKSVSSSMCANKKDFDKLNKLLKRKIGEKLISACHKKDAIQLSQLQFKPIFGSDKAPSGDHADAESATKLPKKKRKYIKVKSPKKRGRKCKELVPVTPIVKTISKKTTRNKSIATTTAEYIASLVPTIDREFREKVLKGKENLTRMKRSRGNFLCCTKSSNDVSYAALYNEKCICSKIIGRHTTTGLIERKLTPEQFATWIPKTLSERTKMLLNDEFQRKQNTVSSKTDLNEDSVKCINISHQCQFAANIVHETKHVQFDAEIETDDKSSNNNHLGASTSDGMGNNMELDIVNTKLVSDDNNNELLTIDKVDNQYESCAKRDNSSTGVRDIVTSKDNVTSLSGSVMLLPETQPKSINEMKRLCNVSASIDELNQPMQNAQKTSTKHQPATDDAIRKEIVKKACTTVLRSTSTREHSVEKASQPFMFTSSMFQSNLNPSLCVVQPHPICYGDNSEVVEKVSILLEAKRRRKCQLLLNEDESSVLNKKPKHRFAIEKSIINYLKSDSTPTVTTRRQKNPSPTTSSKIIGTGTKVSEKSACMSKLHSSVDKVELAQNNIAVSNMIPSGLIDSGKMVPPEDSQNMVIGSSNPLVLSNHFQEKRWNGKFPVFNKKHEYTNKHSKIFLTNRKFKPTSLLKIMEKQDAEFAVSHMSISMEYVRKNNMNKNFSKNIRNTLIPEGQTDPKEGMKLSENMARKSFTVGEVKEADLDPYFKYAILPNSCDTTEDATPICKTSSNKAFSKIYLNLEKKVQNSEKNIHVSNTNIIYERKCPGENHQSFTDVCEMEQDLNKSTKLGTSGRMESSGKAENNKSVPPVKDVYKQLTDLWEKPIESSLITVPSFNDIYKELYSICKASNKSTAHLESKIDCHGKAFKRQLEKRLSLNEKLYPELGPHFSLKVAKSLYSSACQKNGYPSLSKKATARKRWPLVFKGKHSLYFRSSIRKFSRNKKLNTKHEQKEATGLTLENSVDMVGHKNYGFTAQSTRLNGLHKIIKDSQVTENTSISNENENPSENSKIAEQLHENISKATQEMETSKKLTDSAPFVNEKENLEPKKSSDCLSNDVELSDVTYSSQICNGKSSSAKSSIIHSHSCAKDDRQYKDLKPNYTSPVNKSMNDQQKKHMKRRNETDFLLDKIYSKNSLNMESETDSFNLRKRQIHNNDNSGDLEKMESKSAEPSTKCDVSSSVPSTDIQGQDIPLNNNCHSSLEELSPEVFRVPVNDVTTPAHSSLSLTKAYVALVRCTDVDNSVTKMTSERFTAFTRNLRNSYKVNFFILKRGHAQIRPKGLKISKLRQFIDNKYEAYNARGYRNLLKGDRIGNLPTVYNISQECDAREVVHQN